MTAHKVQGKTFSDRSIRINGKTMPRNDVYVSLSRATESSAVEWDNIDDEIFTAIGVCEERQLLRDFVEEYISTAFVKLPHFIIFDSGLQFVSSVNDLDGYDFYIIEKLLLFRPSILVVIYP